MEAGNRIFSAVEDAEDEEDDGETQKKTGIPRIKRFDEQNHSQSVAVGQVVVPVSAIFLLCFKIMIHGITCCYTCTGYND